MASGADLEAAHTNWYAVGAALQRVQGSDRLLLEKYRGEARLKAAQQRTEADRIRAEQLTAPDADAVRQRVVIPLDELLRPEGPQALPADELRRRMAVSHASQPAVSESSASPAAASTDAVEDNPFVDDVPETPLEAPAAQPVEADSSGELEPAEKSASENPFGEL
jgi:hypothetical protein